MSIADDPGWRPALRPVWHLLLPWIAVFFRPRRLGLIGLRRLFLHVGILLIEVAIAISWTYTGSARDTMGTWIILGLGSTSAIGGLVWSTKAWRPPDRSSLSSAESVANSFRVLSFIRLAFTASPALFGIAGVELTGAPELGFVGTGVSVILIATFGPTRSRIDEVQERLRAFGSPISLRAALDETAS